MLKGLVLRTSPLLSVSQNNQERPATMTDIVERLLSFGPDWARRHNDGKDIPYGICVEAAQEIKRLREELRITKLTPAAQ
jgi:hypothetical protein